MPGHRREAHRRPLLHRDDARGYNNLGLAIANAGRPAEAELVRFFQRRIALAGAPRGQDLSAFAFENPVGWALEVLGFGEGSVGPGDGAPSTGRPAGHGSRRPDRSAVTRRFRELLREAHPDHGGEQDGAAQRIADLAEARRILLARAE